jgi:hypothetical protein
VVKLLDICHHHSMALPGTQGAMAYICWFLPSSPLPLIYFIPHLVQPLFVFLLAINELE